MTSLPTLFALSSGRPPAAIAVIRISGPRAFDAAALLSGGKLPSPRTAGLRTLRDPVSGDVLDKALLLLFPGPGSATGEDLAELHLHGGVAVVAAVLRVLERVEGLRAAGPGDFTRRAFENNVLDLPQVEGLADLLSAETEMQRRQAMAHADGHLSRLAEEWRERLLDLLALVEASLDFADEGDVGESEESYAKEGIARLSHELARVLESPSGERLREGVRLVISGPPNAGKSSLINILSQRDVAIVTPIAGTTRDRIEAHLTIRGIPFVAIDTAGLRETADIVEHEGIARARAAAAAADMVIAMAGPDGDFSPVETYAGVVLQVESRSDLSGKATGQDADGIYHLSAATGDGLGALTERLANEAGRLVGHGEILTLANERQLRAVRDCHAALVDASEAADPVLIAEHLRQALSAIGRLTGRVGVEDMLDALFGRFCIGK
jgi:tRNA modification GTPase